MDEFDDGFFGFYGGYFSDSNTWSCSAAFPDSVMSLSVLFVVLLDSAGFLTIFDFFFWKNAATLGCRCSSGRALSVGVSIPAMSGNWKRGLLRAFLDLRAAVDCFRNRAASFRDGWVDEFDGLVSLSSGFVGLSSMICCGRMLSIRPSMDGPDSAVSEFDDCGSFACLVIGVDGFVGLVLSSMCVLLSSMICCASFGFEMFFLRVPGVLVLSSMN
jgi:hypothetical protein